MWDFADTLLVVPPQENDTRGTILWTLSRDRRQTVAELRRLMGSRWQVSLLRDGAESSVYRFLLHSDAVAYGVQMKRALLADGWTLT
ncbi:MAG TPA: hypothetical protein VGG73_09075 [Vicinamibacterales bacterium]|jgi:hypothetical protein